MRLTRYLTMLLIMIAAGSCVSKFIPEVREAGEMMVVEGLITDQPGPYTVKLSKSVPLGEMARKKPLRGCLVAISDDAGNEYLLEETEPGSYETDSAGFRGVAGRIYQLRIKVGNPSLPGGTYESLPMEMKPVPPIDSLYYEKVTIRERQEYSPLMEGCHVYLDTHDPDGKCRFYRWTFTETWEIRLPWATEKSICWTSENSKSINIKTTSSLSQDRITGFPLCFISNETDRLAVKYSMLVNQFSVSEDEFDYWSKLKSITEESGSLYDITPATLAGNVYNVENPYEQVLGFFSVSSVSSGRLFIKDRFSGLVDNLYADCINDTVGLNDSIPGLNQIVWILVTDAYSMPPYRLLTVKRGCADCTVRGTNTEPEYWRDDED